MKAKGFEMKNPQIHPTAIIEAGAKFGKDLCVGPYAVIESGARIGKGCIIHSHAVIKKYTVLGDGVEVGHFTVVGGDPQHLSFDRSVPSQVVIGKFTRIGEGVTVHRSIEQNGNTSVGENCFLMGYSHVAHDCLIENEVILANGVLLGGHVEVGAYSFLGGGASVHQFVRTGKGVMVGGLAEISQDVPPQVLVSGRNCISGLNLIGLKRRKNTRAEISDLKNCFRKIFESTNLKKTAQAMINGSECPESIIARQFLGFFMKGDRGFAKPPKIATE